MGRRKRASVASDGCERTRITISIPKWLDELFPESANKSRIISILLEENIERFTEQDLEDVQRKRIENSTRFIMSKLNEVSGNIARKVSEEDTHTFRGLVGNTDRQMEEMKRLGIQLKEVKDSLVNTQNIRKIALKSAVESELKDFISRTIGEPNLRLLVKNEDNTEEEEDER